MAISVFSVILFFTNVVHSRAQNIETIVDSFAHSTQFSGVVLYADNGKILFEKAYGFRDFSRHTPLKKTDIFELASVSKSFTAMVIMLLKEKNKLNLDDLVSKYLAIPYQGITIRHLLNHTSGLPDYEPIMDKYWDKGKVAGNEHILEYLNRYHPPILFEPGNRYRYSNTGYLLLASIAEIAGGMDFIEFMRREIFETLGMTDTNIRTLAAKKAIKNFAVGHVWSPDKQKFIRAKSSPSSDYNFWLGDRKGSGRVSSTAYDLLKWDQALYTEKLVTRATLDEAFNSVTLINGAISNYGFGWDIRTDPFGNKIVSHDGDTAGYKAQIIRIINSKRTLIILCNNPVGSFSGLIKMLIRAFQ